MSNASGPLHFQHYISSIDYIWLDQGRRPLRHPACLDAEVGKKPVYKRENIETNNNNKKQ